MIQGNLPVELIDTRTLQNILRNVTLQLPDGFELIFGPKTENLDQYFQITKVAVIANMHRVKLLISLHLKASHQLFTLHRIITLPERISSDRFI